MKTTIRTKGTENSGTRGIRTLAPASLPALVLALSFAGSAFAGAQGDCPDIRALQNGVVRTSTDIGADFTLSDVSSTIGNDTATYTLCTPDESGESGALGVPGVQTYCVYPNQPPGNPDSAAASVGGANGNEWVTNLSKVVQGYFAFERPDGDPSNLPLDGNTSTVGAASWCQPDSGTCTVSAPSNQTIVLRINDADECQSLYPGSADTGCFVIAQSCDSPRPSVTLCNGNPACKQVVIDEACTGTPLTVPYQTLLHLHYEYIIVNQPGSGYDMTFLRPTAKTSDINNGGGKDYWGCEQTDDPNGQPGIQVGARDNYDTTGMTLSMSVPKLTSRCQQSRFTLTDGTASDPGSFSGAPITLTPGNSITFEIDMVTRKLGNGIYEYSTTGEHLLNSGFTVKWFQSCPNNAVDTSANPIGCNTTYTPQSGDDGLLHSFSTNINPIYVYAAASCS